MARLLQNKIAWKYTTDAGEVYRVNALKDITSQTKLGGTAANGSEAPLPTGFKMRRLLVSNTTIGRSRMVPIYSSGAPILTPAASVNLNSGGIVGEEYVEDSYAFSNNQSVPVKLVPEKHPRVSPVTRQTA
jgi:hypothetical protein